MAPDLVRIQRHFQDKGVVFVSLTPDAEADARKFALRYRIAWSMGWGASEVVKRYLEHRYPALLVVGRDGRVVGNDGSARLQHQGEEALPQLIQQIEKALSDEGN